MVEMNERYISCIMEPRLGVILEIKDNEEISDEKLDVYVAMYPDANLAVYKISGTSVGDLLTAPVMTMIMAQKVNDANPNMPQSLAILFADKLVALRMCFIEYVLKQGRDDQTADHEIEAFTKETLAYLATLDLDFEGITEYLGIVHEKILLFQNRMIEEYDKFVMLREINEETSSGILQEVTEEQKVILGELTKELAN